MTIINRSSSFKTFFAGGFSSTGGVASSLLCNQEVKSGLDGQNHEQTHEPERHKRHPALGLRQAGSPGADEVGRND